MEISTNENGQTLVHLNKDEWENYGQSAGFMDVEKTASVETPINQIALKKIASIREDINIYQNAIATKVAELDEAIAELQTEEVEVVEASTEDEVKESVDFNENNYPNLLAQEEQDGLIGPFTKTSPCV